MTAALHSLSCTNAPCRCKVLWPVREAYNDDAGNEPVIAKIADDPADVLIPRRSGRSVPRGMSS